MVIVGSILVLALFFTCELAMLYDIDCAIDEAMVDELWDGDDE